jgi:hypothetical protein
MYYWLLFEEGNSEHGGLRGEKRRGGRRRDGREGKDCTAWPRLRGSMSRKARILSDSKSLSDGMSPGRAWVSLSKDSGSSKRGGSTLDDLAENAGRHGLNLFSGINLLCFVRSKDKFTGDELEILLTRHPLASSRQRIVPRPVRSVSLAMSWHLTSTLIPSTPLFSPTLEVSAMQFLISCVAKSIKSCVERDDDEARERLHQPSRPLINREF